MATAAIGADVMVDSPAKPMPSSNRPAEWSKTALHYLHVFTYSPVPAHPQPKCQDSSRSVARARNRVLRDLAADKKQAFMQASQDDRRSHHSGVWHWPGCPRAFAPPLYEALTDNYLPLRLLGNMRPINGCVHGSKRWKTGKLVECRRPRPTFAHKPEPPASYLHPARFSMVASRNPSPQQYLTASPLGVVEGATRQHRQESGGSECGSC